jgi:Zn-dependent protease with chaperone function
VSSTPTVRDLGTDAAPAAASLHRCGPGLLIALLVVLAGCAEAPDRAYYPDAQDSATLAVSHALYRAAVGAGDDPVRYSFALVASRDVAAYTTDDATFYLTDGLARQATAVIEPLVAHEVAHEVLGHAGQRRALTLSLRAGFTVLGVVVPGVGLLDIALNPLIVRAFTRDQEIAADLKAVQILASMGYACPRRALADALGAAFAVNGRPGGGWLASEPSLDDRVSALEPLEPVATPLDARAH